MARKKHPKSSYEISTLKDNLQELPVRVAIGKTRKGSGHRMERLLAELKEYRASEIAEVLGIRTQKYNALINEIEYRGKSTGALNDLLENTLHELQSRTQNIDEEIPVYDPDERRTYRVHLETTIEPEETFDEEYPNAREVKLYKHRAFALRYLARMPGAEEYFQIVQRGFGKNAHYSIMDTRDPSEQGHRMKRRKHD